MIVKEKINFDNLIDESIKVENLMAELYLKFYDISLEDSGFWLELAKEEEAHAELIGGIRDIPQRIIGKLLQPSLVDLKESNEFLSTLIERYSRKTPTREEAFNLALLLEGIVGELNYKRVLSTKDHEPKLYEIFQELNGYDMDHEDRLKSYMKKNGIQVHQWEIMTS